MLPFHILQFHYDVYNTLTHSSLLYWPRARNLSTSAAQQPLSAVVGASTQCRKSHPPPGARSQHNLFSRLDVQNLDLRRELCMICASVPRGRIGNVCRKSPIKRKDDQPSVLEWFLCFLPAVGQYQGERRIVR
eukprot:g37392.t1